MNTWRKVLSWEVQDDPNTEFHVGDRVMLNCSEAKLAEMLEIDTDYDLPAVRSYFRFKGTVTQVLPPQPPFRARYLVRWRAPEMNRSMPGWDFDEYALKLA